MNVSVVFIFFINYKTIKEFFSILAYVKIPLKWHEHFIDNSVSEELRKEILKILTKLILKKRITRIIPRKMNGLNHHHSDDVNQVKNGDANNNDDDEMNDIEIEQQLWTVVARSSNDNFV